MKKLRVLVTAEELTPERIEGATVVVIDVFLATTTLVTILENGARAVYPVSDLDEAAAVCDGLDPARRVRGGEQNARPIDGFECGPYPHEYPPERIAGRDVVFVTTNGTRAIGRATGASELLVASLRNAPAVARHLDASDPEAVYLVCAGSRGRLTLEDFLGAAVILSRMDLDGRRLNDAAWLARDLAARHGGRVPDVLRQSRAGRWFCENGHEATLTFAAAVGESDLVPEVRDGRMVRVEM